MAVTVISVLLVAVLTSVGLEQTTFNKHRKYNYKSKHMHDNICYITQSKTGYVPPGRHSVIAECRDALNMHTDYT